MFGINVVTFSALWMTVSVKSATKLSPGQLSEVTRMSIYYDPLSHRPLHVTDTIPERDGSSKQSELDAQTTSDGGQLYTTAHKFQFQRIGYRSNGCTCHGLTCGCCFGMNITQFNFDQKGCMNLTYDPQEFAIVMNMLWNDESIYTNSVSGKNPPPLCIPVPTPPVPIPIPTLDFCAKLFNIFTPGRNIHFCLDLETRIQRAPILVLHFDCMRMGNDGVALVKPGDNGGLPETTEAQPDADIYDEVTEIKYISSLRPLPQP